MKSKLMRIGITVLTALCVVSGGFLAPSSSAAAEQTKIKGSEVLVIGDSFLAMSREITKELEKKAKAAGIMDQNDKFVDNSVSGTMLNGGISPTIPTQYKNGVSSNKIKYVIMDGGGNDCMMGSVDGAINAFRTLMKQMESDGIVKVFYLFYPDAQGGLAGTLNPNLNRLRPVVQEGVTSLKTTKGYFLDLRPTFEGKYSQYILSDGIHPTTAGSVATANAIWEVMQKENFFGTEQPNPVNYGDYNNDGRVNSVDLLMFKQYLLESERPYIESLDVNRDKAVNAIDLLIMKQYILGIVTALPTN